MNRLLSLLLLCCALHLPAKQAEITVKAEASGSERAIEQSRQALADKCEDNLRQHRRKVLSAALPAYPFSDALPPAAVMRLLADSANVTVKRDENTRRYVATATISPEAFSRLETRNSALHAAACRTRLLASQKAPDAAESLRLLIQALTSALELTALSPADNGLPDSLGAAVRGTLEHLVVALPGDLLLREGEALTVRVRVYIAGQKERGLAGIPVSLSGEPERQTDSDGWATFSLASPHSGDYAVRARLVDTLIPENIGYRKSLRIFLRQYVGKEETDFRVTIAGRRKTWLESNLHDATDIRAHFERLGHRFVEDRSRADWVLRLNVRTVREGTHPYGGYVAVLQASLQLSDPRGITIGDWQTGQVEGFSATSAVDARRRAEADVKKKLLDELNK